MQLQCAKSLIYQVTLMCQVTLLCQVIYIPSIFSVPGNIDVPDNMSVPGNFNNSVWLNLFLVQYLMLGLKCFWTQGYECFLLIV